MPMSEFIKRMVEQIENKGNGTGQGQSGPESNSDAPAPTGQDAGSQNQPVMGTGSGSGGDAGHGQPGTPNTPTPGAQTPNQLPTGTQEDTPKFNEPFVKFDQFPDRNKFIQKEYVDTYAAEKDYDKELENPNSSKNSIEEKKRAIKDAADNPSAAPTDLPDEADDRNGLEKMLQSDEMGNISAGVDAASDVVGLGMQSNSLDKMLKANKSKNNDDIAAAEEAEKQANKASIATNAAGLVTGSIGTYNDEVQRRNDAAAGKVGEKHSNNLAVAADAFGLASNATGLVGGSLGVAGKDENVTGVLGSGLGTVGSILGMSGHADRVRRQNQAIGSLKQNVNGNDKRKSKLSKDYIRATRAKRFGSGFETGAGVANVISSGLGLAGDSISAAGGNKTLSAILGVVSTVVGLLAKGLSFMGGVLESKRNKKNKDEVVDEYIRSKADKVKQHSPAEKEGGKNLTKNEKQNIVIARLGVQVTDYSTEDVIEQKKDEIFKRIGLKRVKQAKQDKDFLKTIGLEESASDDAILEALGYGD